MVWRVELAEDAVPAVVREDGERIPVQPRSPHPLHLAHAQRVARGLCAQLNEKKEWGSGRPADGALERD